MGIVVIISNIECVIATKTRGDVRFDYFLLYLFLWKKKNKIINTTINNFAFEMYLYVQILFDGSMKSTVNIVSFA